MDQKVHLKVCNITEMFTVSDLCLACHPHILIL